MVEQNQIEAAQEDSQEELQSSWWRLQGIFLEPHATFRQIARKPTVLLPLLAIILVGVAVNYFVIDQIGYENILRQQLNQSPQLQDLPAERREELIRSRVNSPVFRVLAYVGPVFGAVAILIAAALLLLGVRVLGSDSPFKHVFSVTCHSYFAYAVVTGLLLCLVVLVSSDRSTIDVQNAVQSHLGLLVDKADSPALYALASSFDIISFYLMYLLALGLSSLGRKPSFGGALGVVIFWWALWVTGKVGFAMLFS